MLTGRVGVSARACADRACTSGLGLVLILISCCLAKNYGNEWSGNAERHVATKSAWHKMSHSSIQKPMLAMQAGAWCQKCTASACNQVARHVPWKVTTDSWRDVHGCMAGLCGMYVCTEGLPDSVIKKRTGPAYLMTWLSSSYLDPSATGRAAICCSYCSCLWIHHWTTLWLKTSC